MAQHFVGQAGDGVLLVHDERHTRQARHDAPGESDVTPHAQHHIRPHGFNDTAGSQAGAQQIHRQHELAHDALATYRGKFDPGTFVTPCRNQLGFHAIRITQPDHAPTLRAQDIGDGQGGENMAARAARHNKESLMQRHGRRPRII